MSKEMWAQVRKFADGDNLDAETLNIPIGQLGDRTSYLYSRLKELVSSGKMSSVVLTNVRLSTEEGRSPRVGNAVYLDKSGCFAAAKATMSLYDDFTASDSAFTVGILTMRDNDSAFGNVLVYGSMDMNPSGSAIQEENMIESGEQFRPGRYYLSSNEAGRLTSRPNGPLVYVCTISGDVVSGGINGTAIVSPQFLDIGTSHVHRTAVLTARPAGTISTAGYLPIDQTVDAGKAGPLALRFGGTWTSKSRVDYKFYLNQGSADWPGGVVLYWMENGIQDEDRFRVVIPAPDVEVPISNGLTVRLSLPDSDPKHAYSGLSEDRRTWHAMTFPDAGRGWLDHESSVVLESEDVASLRIILKSRLGTRKEGVSVAFPLGSDILDPGAIQEGTKFSYSDSVYEFVRDKTSYSGDNIPVDLGTHRADSCRFLADEINKTANGVVCTFDPSYSGSDPGASEDDVRIVVMDGGVLMKYDDSLGEFVEILVKTVEGSDFELGRNLANVVVFNDDHVIMSGSPVVEGIGPYGWFDAGTVSMMVYQTSSGTVVPVGTVAHGDLVDDEPNAIYDYVIGLDRTVANHWPPVPVKSAALVVNGVEMDNRALVPSNPTVSFGTGTIHWFSDQPGKKPWPDGFISRDYVIDPAYDKIEVLHWVRGFQGSTGPVTSLQVKPGSPIRIVGYGTEDEANTGDLEIEAAFDFRMVGGGAPGFMVPKRASGGNLVAGPVVERIVGGAGVNVISAAGCPDGQGTVVIGLDNDAYANQFTDIALENAEQAKIGMFPYIRLKGYAGSISSPSAFTATMRVPMNLPDMKYALKITASVFGENGFTSQIKQAACLKFSYNILPDFTAVGQMRYRDLKTSLLKPDGDRTVIIPFGHTSDGGIVYNGFDPILISTDDESLHDADDVVEKVLGKRIPHRTDFALQTVVPELRPGYLVGIRFTRAITSAEGVDPYTGAIGFINLAWSLVAEDDYGIPSRPTGDIYARNTRTGLFHAVVAVTDDETGHVDIGVDQQGIPGSK